MARWTMTRHPALFVMPAVQHKLMAGRRSIRLQECTPAIDEDLCDDILRIPFTTAISTTGINSCKHILSMLNPHVNMDYSDFASPKVSLTKLEEKKILQLVERTDISGIEFYDNEYTKTNKKFYSQLEKLCESKCDANKQVGQVPGTSETQCWETHSGPLNPSVHGTPKHKVKHLNLIHGTPSSLQLHSKVQEKPIKKIKITVQEKPVTNVSTHTPATADHYDVKEKIEYFMAGVKEGWDEAILLRTICEISGSPSLSFPIADDFESCISDVLNDESRNQALKDECSLLMLNNFVSTAEISISASIKTIAMSYLRSLEGTIDDPKSMSIEIMSRFFAKISKDESERLPLLTYCIESAVNLKNQILFSSYAKFIALVLDSDKELEKYIIESIFGSENCCLKKSCLYWISLHYKLLYAKNVSAEAASIQVSSICKYLLERIKVSSGMHPLISSIDALKTLLEIPELPMMPLFFKQIILYAFQVFISDKLKIEVAAKGLLLDGLIEVAAFLRNLERSLTNTDQVQFDLDYFFALPVSIDLKESILDSYKKFNNYSPSDMSKKTSAIEGHWNVLLLGSLNGLSEKIILFLLKVVSDQAAPLKVKSIRGMIAILDKNDTFCSSSGFIDIIISKTKDASVSVRDASLELISKCFDNHQLTSDKFFDAVLSRIQDSSLCVRKRVIKLLANIVSEVNEYNVEELIIAKLLLVSADDEENMSNLAVKLIKERWISRVCMQSLKREDLILFVASTIRVIKHLEERSDALQSFISKLFNSKKIDEHFEKACTLIVDVLFESLVSAIEVANYPAVTFILKAILVFVSHNFSMLESHLRLLYELIKSNEMQVIELALYLMKESMPFCSRTSINPIVTHLPDITRLVLKGSEAVIKNAVEFLRRAAAFLPEDHPDITFELWTRFDQFLESKLNSKIDKNINLLLCRALFSYGCLTHSMFQREAIEPHFLDRPLQVLSIFFGHGLKSANASLAFYALQPCSLLIGTDNELVYRQEISRILHLSLSSSVPQLVSCVLEIFLNISMKSKSTQSLSFNTSMQNDDTNISCSIVQNFIKELVTSIYLDEPKCHHMALKLFSLVILYGFSHPNQVIPSIVALSTSKISNVSSKALEIIQLLQETHFSFLYSNYSEILKACFQFHSTSDTPRGFQLTDDSFHSILDAYYLGIRGKRSKRNMFLELLLKEIEIGLSNTEDVHYSLFCIEILSMLTFKTYEELSFVLLKLDEIIFSLSDIEQNSNMDLIKFCYLIELKHYLRRTYNISNEISTDQIPNDQRLLHSVSKDPLNIENYIEFNDQKLNTLAQNLLEMDTMDQNKIVRSRTKPKKRANRKRRRSNEESEFSDDTDNT